MKLIKEKDVQTHRLTIGLVVIMMFTLSVYGQREIQSLNDQWKFLKGDCKMAETKAFDDSKWEIINIPHTWNTDAYIMRDYYQGKGWYRRPFVLPDRWQGKKVFLKFDAASKAASVYINGEKVGEHAGGYSAFSFDVTSYLRTGDINILAVCVDNDRPDIPPISADFTFFGGIYRDVWLIALPKQHFDMENLASEGVFVSTPLVSAEQGIVSLTGKIKNDATQKVSLELNHALYLPNGTLLQSWKSIVKINGNEEHTFKTQSKPVFQPQLWTPETPCLYRIETTLKDHKTKLILDRHTAYTGFRWYRFDAENGFYLNGKPYKLHGICRHQDQKPIGVAMSDEMHRRDFKLMKEMGANFIRISHYPQDDALLEMCDKLGMLVWEEIPIVDLVPNTPHYAENCERNLREMIRQHYNHTSVILWGYMNEVLLGVERSKGEKRQQMLKRIETLAKHLEKVLKEEDATRLSTMAFHGSDYYNQTTLNETTNVIGWNIYQGWYGGTLKGFDRYIEKQHKEHPTHPMIISEYGAGSDHRLHSLMPRVFDFSIEYQQQFNEHYQSVIENTPYICGGTHWNFIDFSSARRDESMPRINNKGLVYANRIPKDIYYYFKAAWRKDIPVIYIASRDWSQRTGIVENQSFNMSIKVYSNLKEVELFMNGTSLGKKKVKNSSATFDVPFTQGNHFFRANGHYQGKEVEDGMNIAFQAIPFRLTDDYLLHQELAINVGSNCFFTSEESNLTWIPDQPYKEGAWGYIGGKRTDTHSEVINTTDGPLFQCMCKQIEAYRFDVAQGTYEIELLFADIFKERQSSLYSLGKKDESVNQDNAFAISINGKIIEEEFIPSAYGGHFNAIRRKYIVDCNSDHLDVRFQTLRGDTFLNGIKLRKLL